ncbi:MAG: prepilin peptidase, partial [Pirellulaceae bacterium]
GGGGPVWAVRIVGSSALGQEAMGFGDVTLMAAIGAFTGWQATLIIFFLAPFSAVFIAITQFLLTRRHDIAFGPYLCASAVIWLTHSGALWDHYGWPIFSLGWWVPGLGAFGLVLMGILLMLLRMLRGEPIPDAGP